MVNPLISVIVPVYKTEAYLPKCLDSICGQTYRNLEIICVDDESPDRSGEILERYARQDSRIKVIHRKNGGLCAARNSGLAVATGEWVAGVDSDDFLEPDIYEKAVEKLSDQVDILIFGTQFVYEPNVPRDEEREAYFKLPGDGLLRKGDDRIGRVNVCFWNKLWRRSLIEKHGVTFPEGLIREDEYFFRCLAPFVQGIYILPDIGYNYCQRDGSIMHSGKTRLDMFKDILLIVEAIVKTHISSGVVEEGREFVLPFWVEQTSCVNSPRKDMRTAVRMNKELIDKMHLRRLYGHDFRLVVLMPNSWCQRLFKKVRRTGITYRFLGIPLFSVIYEKNHPVRRESKWVNPFKRGGGH